MAVSVNGQECRQLRLDILLCVNVNVGRFLTGIRQGARVPSTDNNILFLEWGVP